MLGGGSLENAFINGWTKDKILAEVARRKVAGLEALNPTEYLSAEYITNHLKEFENGVTKIIANPPTGAVGPPSGTFVMPKVQADNLIKQANGNISKLEELLGLERGALGNNPIRIDVEQPIGLRMPTENELGASDLWIPGGKTIGGVSEATVDQIQLGAYVINSIK